ncbi:MAG: FHA domain-containing protein [Myxococcales bacterium]|nr:FHA domain-containing protein [Polyangiaceae bacterium]MDW8247750.1 FHA domain-containing protein [Myxococcales bacterium]
MIICPKCGKENQDHYKFCLGCGAELPRGEKREFRPESLKAAAPPLAVALAPVPPPPAPPPVTSFPSPTVASPVAPPPAHEPPRPAPAPPATSPVAPASPAPPASITCPQCGATNPPTMRFCMNCGFNLAAAPPPVPAATIAASVPPSTVTAPSGPQLAILTALRADKSEVGSYPIQNGTTVGRNNGGIFAGDSYLSPRHATFYQRNNKLYIKDEGSLNGTFIKLVPEQPTELLPGDVFRIGQEIVRFEPLVPQPPSPDGVERIGSPSKGYVGRLALIIGRDVTGNAFPIPETGVHIGRERGDILFPEDGYVSGLHCRISRGSDGKIYLTDLGSSNGTFVRIKGDRDLRSLDEILMGQQLFRITLLV